MVSMGTTEEGVLSAEVNHHRESSRLDIRLEGGPTNVERADMDARTLSRVTKTFGPLSSCSSSVVLPRNFGKGCKTDV